MTAGYTKDELKRTAPSSGGHRRGHQGNELKRQIDLLPTPRTTDTNGPGQHGMGGPDLRTVVTLLPTPVVNDMGEGKTLERWDEWTAEMQAKHGNGNGHGRSLAIEAMRLLPTPKATNNENRSSDWANGPNLGEAVRDLLPTPRASDGADEKSHGRTWSATDFNLHSWVREQVHGIPTRRSGASTARPSTDGSASSDDPPPTPPISPMDD